MTTSANQMAAEAPSAGSATLGIRNTASPAESPVSRPRSRPANLPATTATRPMAPASEMPTQRKAVPPPAMSAPLTIRTASTNASRIRSDSIVPTIATRGAPVS
jgi:hypothetical protein